MLNVLVVQYRCVLQHVFHQLYRSGAVSCGKERPLWNTWCRYLKPRTTPPKRRQKNFLDDSSPQSQTQLLVLGNSLGDTTAHGEKLHGLFERKASPVGLYYMKTKWLRFSQQKHNGVTYHCNTNLVNQTPYNLIFHDFIWFPGMFLRDARNSLSGIENWPIFRDLTG